MDPPPEQRPEGKIHHQELLSVSHQGEHFQIGIPPRANALAYYQTILGKQEEVSALNAFQEPESGLSTGVLFMWLSREHPGRAPPQQLPTIPQAMRAEALGTLTRTGSRM